MKQCILNIDKSKIKSLELLKNLFKYDFIEYELYEIRDNIKVKEITKYALYINFSRN